MDFWDSLAVLSRRWWIVVLGIVVTVAVALIVFGAISPTYRADGTVVFYAPGKLQLADPNAAPQRANPFLGFDGSVTVTSEITARAATAPNVMQTVTGVSPGSSFTAEPDISARGPILQLSASAPTRVAAVDTLGRGIATMNQTLNDQQQAVGASQDTWVRMAVLRSDKAATPVSGSRWRAALGIVLVGIGCTLMAAFGVDALARARARRREPRPSPVMAPARVAGQPTRAS
ncbi:MAG: hypothetical protein ACOYN3_09270 [Acidimicrobiia bacterium]